ncbi:unnamed protein product [Parnassius apollo]|uniref:(apollo) hypothetical protein n=1 Tax=Parnassius apollo TaxID=110799 RepID=A0A8S3WT51_PARAO|nr:unnamed protein product [Parnassius apollo]
MKFSGNFLSYVIRADMSRKMRDGDIEDLLIRLENGDISDDEEDIGNENDIDYYPNLQDILNVLDIDNDNEEVNENPPLVSEEEPTECAESSSEQPTPGPSFALSVPGILGIAAWRSRSRELIWKKRGSYEEQVADYEGVDISVTTWKDNKMVTLASTYVGAEPAETTTRYDKKQKKEITIPCPKIIKDYNAHMGGVDLMDSFLGRAELAEALCNYKKSVEKRGRPSSSNIEKELEAKKPRRKPVNPVPVKDDVLRDLRPNESNSLELFCKWSCDGSQQAQFKQKMENGATDSNIFQSSFILLRLVCDTKTVCSDPLITGMGQTSKKRTCENTETEYRAHAPTSCAIQLIEDMLAHDYETDLIA